MTERTVKGIFFDLGWTLEYPAGDDWTLTNRFFHYVSREYFYSLPEEVRLSGLQRAFQPLIDHHHMTTCEEENQRYITYYSDLNRYLQLDLSRDAVADIARDHTYNFSNYILFPSAASTLKTLKEHGYRIGVISDTWPSTVPQQKEAGLYDYYDFLVLSCDLGVLKPDLKMYTTALEKMGLAPEETLYVDDLTMSLDAAGTFGIPGVCSIVQHPDTPVEGYPCIRHPGELIDLIKVRCGGLL